MPLEVWKNIRGDAVGELELEAQKKAVGGIDAPIDRQVLSMSAKGCSSVQGEEKVREEGGRVLGRRSGGPRSKSHYGYKNHVNVDRRHKLVRRYQVTDAAVHDSQVVEDILDADNTASDVWADSAYRSAEIEPITVPLLSSQRSKTEPASAMKRHISSSPSDGLRLATLSTMARR